MIETLNSLANAYLDSLNACISDAVKTHEEADVQQRAADSGVVRDCHDDMNRIERFARVERDKHVDTGEDNHAHKLVSQHEVESDYEKLLPDKSCLFP